MTLEEELIAAYDRYLCRMASLGKTDEQWNYDEFCVKSMDAVSIKCRRNGQKDAQKELPIELQRNPKLGRRSEWS
ncbi:hypothetical protein BcepF1.004 [Burkholderia phage BcepF1]|uniref:Uncharacterized protein n=1 Tax=Burkholderia phage BcepF1 TaxID=2886897 RepID=A1YZQ8_9CAUD|nr:hypothetical protein BcepF1.004 [Burkholderia phage BcepF1]ABL96735.1 hypothetical protein BcepF1.004 [Burkholderia phage BcepF1]